MAPKNKEPESEVNNDVVCKKIKEDKNQPTTTEVVESSDDKLKEKEHKEFVKESGDVKVKENNNNNNDISTNGSAQPKEESETTNGAKVNTETTSNTTEKKEDQPVTTDKPDDKTTEQPKKEIVDEDKKEETSTIKTSEETTESKEDSTDDELVGTLLLCGGANWDMTGRKELPKNAKKPTNNLAARNLWAPNRVRMDSSSDKPLRVKGVFSGCNACHSVIVTDDGKVLTFGRNDKGQLGLGDTETRFTPVVVEKFEGINIVAAACGRSHTLFLDSDGIVYATGDNKMGQCGIDKPSVQQITTPQRIVFKEAKPIVKMACGAEFSMIVDADGRLYSFGHPEHGQLGHNSEGKYFTSGNKYAFHCEHTPRRIHTYISKTREGHITPVDDVKIVDIACGTNHTLAVDSKRRCFSWGFAGYHRLGHSETKNELVPRSIKVFESPNNPDRGAVRVAAGSQHSMAIDVHGVLYFWGQNKSSGEATMYPKVVQDLCGWKISSLSCANRSIFLAAEGSCVSWGPSPTYGELGYGEGRAKSSTTPDEVKTLDNVHVLHVACGFGHTLLIARDKKPEDQKGLNKLSLWP